MRSGPAAAPEKEEPENLWQSLVACCRVCASWGKALPNSSQSPEVFHVLRVSVLPWHSIEGSIVLCYVVCLYVCLCVGG